MANGEGKLLHLTQKEAAVIQYFFLALLIQRLQITHELWEVPIFVKFRREEEKSTKIKSKYHNVDPIKFLQPS